MDELQKVTSQGKSVDAEFEIIVEGQLSYAQQKWIDFCAIGGLIVDDDNSIRQMTITQFAEQLGVARKTLYEWKRTIPNFMEKAHKRRSEIGGSPARVAKVYNGLFLKAATGNADAAKLWLQAFANWKPPKQEMEIDHNLGLADLVAKKKIELERERNIIDVRPTADETSNS